MTSTDTTQALVVPTTGELVVLDDPEQCAKLLVELRELETRIKELKRALSGALVEASRTQGTKTLHLPGMIATVSAKTSTTWDYEILAELLAAGLPQERFDDLVSEEVSYKINGLVAKSIASSNPVYGEIIERAQTKRELDPSVAVKAVKQ